MNLTATTHSSISEHNHIYSCAVRVDEDGHLGKRTSKRPLILPPKPIEDVMSDDDKRGIEMEAAFGYRKEGSPRAIVAVQESS